MKRLLLRLRTAWEDFLRKLGRANRETYGAGGPDCCGPKAPVPPKQAK